MLVTCQICRKKIERDTAHKIVVNGRNKYYCSTSEFEKEELRKKKIEEDKDKVYYLICDIMGEKEILNTILWKEKSEWNKAFSDEIIAKYLEENKERLTSMIARLSTNEFAKIRYLSTILRNSLRDYKSKNVAVERPKVAIDETIYNPSTRSRNGRRSLADLEDEI